MIKWKKKIEDFLKNDSKLAKKLSRVDEDAIALIVLKKFFENNIKNKSKMLSVITPTLVGAEKLNVAIREYLELLNLNDKINILFLAEEKRGNIELAGALNSKIRSLQLLLENRANIVIGSAYSFANRTQSVENFKKSNITLNIGDKVNFNHFLEKLVEFDYDDELEIATHGEFSRRGGIIDVFSPEYDYPVRVEFWGDEIEDIRKFDVETQRSSESVKNYRVISKVKPTIDDDSCEYSSALDYLSQDCNLILFERDKIQNIFLQFNGESEFKYLNDYIEKKSQEPDYLELFEQDKVENSEIAPCFVPLSDFSTLNLKAKADEISIENYKSMDFMRKIFFERLEYYANLEYEIVILSNHKERIKTMKEYCYIQAPKLEKHLTFDCGFLNNGVVFPHKKLIVLSENEALTANAFKKKNLATTFKSEEDKRKEFNKNIELNDDNDTMNFPFAQFAEGDYIVHLTYGIGVFKSIVVAKDKSGFVRELLEIGFQDEQKILIPISQSYQISKYMGNPGKVRLSKLSSNKWNNDKIAAARAIKDYAAQMLRLQAVRNVQEGISFNINELDLKLFLSEFPYVDTLDQSKATFDIQIDMEQSKPMDRLLCGDVGYGKTEVAMRAAFMAANAGYQVAVLAPTTILVQQHYESFLERFAQYPFIIENLSRFKTPKEQREILQRLGEGKIDILIGTSALCSNSINFKNLGLLIIDEEQRFGVKQKEKLREFRTQIDVLSMSATPIPRTLYMSMAGARDLSTLVTAPKERMEVKTMIAPIKDDVIKEAINYELGRRGQLFYLHNRVKTIDDCCQHLQDLVPNCRFAVAHGQMDEKSLERIMTDYQNGKIDCLVATTIIESGLDIPNANTMIIERADRFGLSELYQLRGRVGRWKHQAFTYMLLPEKELISTDARKRINAIRRCNSLGAGFQLALQDLEIRGSGNLLGIEQSGHLNCIGFELYCQMLKLEIAKMKNQDVEFIADVDINLDFLMFGLRSPSENIAVASFPRDYIESDSKRIEIYRVLASKNSVESIELYKLEIEDRFGKLPEASEFTFLFAKLKLLVSKAGFRKLSVNSGVIYLQIGGTSYRDKSGKIPRIDDKNSPKLKMIQLIKIVEKILKDKMTDK